MSNGTPIGLGCVGTGQDLRDGAIEVMAAVGQLASPASMMKIAIKYVVLCFSKLHAPDHNHDPREELHVVAPLGFVGTEVCAHELLIVVAVVDAAEPKRRADGGRYGREEEEDEAEGKFEQVPVEKRHLLRA